MVMFSIFWIAVVCLITLLLRIFFEILSALLEALWLSGTVVALISGISVFLFELMGYVFKMSAGYTHLVDGIFLIVVVLVICAVGTVLLILLCGIGGLISKLFENIGDFFRNRFESLIKKLTTKLNMI